MFMLLKGRYQCEDVFQNLQAIIDCAIESTDIKECATKLLRLKVRQTTNDGRLKMATSLITDICEFCCQHISSV